MNALAVAVVGFWAMLPAYVPNNAAVLVGGGPPIDAGRTWRGDRLLGDGKTWQGTAGGTLVGVLVALGLNAVNGAVGGTLAGIALPAFPLVVVVVLPLGAMLGDIVASFVKRRIGQERGASVPGLDQMDFVVVALGLTAAADLGWFSGVSLDPVWVLVFVVVVTPVLHLSTNYVAYLLGLKDVPW